MHQSNNDYYNQKLYKTLGTDRNLLLQNGVSINFYEEVFTEPNFYSKNNTSLYYSEIKLNAQIK